MPQSLRKGVPVEPQRSVRGAQMVQDGRDAFVVIGDPSRGVPDRRP
jgi:hypothetical protein